jgi:hypothetical protein
MAFTRVGSLGLLAWRWLLPPTPQEATGLDISPDRQAVVVTLVGTAQRRGIDIDVLHIVAGGVSADNA